MADISERQGAQAAAATVRGIWPRMALRWLNGADIGEITITFPSGAVHRQIGGQEGPSAAIEIHRLAAIRKTLLRGDIGLAEGYMDGDWSSLDLGALLDYGYRNEGALAGSMRASAIFGSFLRLRHWRRANTRRGAKRNIAYHYDLGNEFYRLWLDPSMTYSSALFEGEGSSLEEAQSAKYRRIVSSLDIESSDHVLEIGCGWGGFAELAARETGCRFTCITLSQDQAIFARKSVSDAGLSEQIEIRIQDYRDVNEQFDKIVSIEMFEAVGEENWPVYFDKVHDNLKPEGRANLQIITVAEDRFETYRNNIDFIRRYIFPGGLLPTKALLADRIGAARMRLSETFSFGHSYAETLRRWRRTFEERWAEIGPLGFDERFRRMWAFYLCGSEASFEADACDVSQFLIER